MYTIFCCVPASAVHLHSVLHTLQHMCVPAAVMLLPLSLCACCASVADHASTAWGLASIAAVLLLSCTCLLSTAAVPPYAAMQKGDSLRRDRAPKHRQAKALAVEHQPGSKPEALAWSCSNTAASRKPPAHAEGMPRVSYYALGPMHII